MKFLVTALWSDGWTNVEEYATVSLALGFVKEVLENMELNDLSDSLGLVSIKIERLG